MIVAFAVLLLIEWFAGVLLLRKSRGEEDSKSTMFKWLGIGVFAVSVLPVIAIVQLAAM